MVQPATQSVSTYWAVQAPGTLRLGLSFKKYRPAARPQPEGRLICWFGAPGARSEPLADMWPLDMAVELATDHRVHQIEFERDREADGAIIGRHIAQLKAKARGQGLMS